MNIKDRSRLGKSPSTGNVSTAETKSETESEAKARRFEEMNRAAVKAARYN